MELVGRVTEVDTIDTGLPKYEQLYARLVGDVQKGRLKPGDLLPPEPQFAEQLNLARSTVRQALAQMERNGLIRRIRGKGTYIHEDASMRLRSGLDAFALIVPDTQSGYYPSLVAGFEEAAGAVRNQVIVVSTRNESSRQGDAILQLIDKQVAGVAIVPAMAPATPAYQVRQLQKHNIPVVLCHREVDGVRAPVLTFSARDIGRLAGQAILRRGHRRVAYVTTLRSGFGETYESGLRAALEAGGSSLPNDRAIYLGTAGYNDSEAYEQAMERALVGLMSLPAAERPTALFTGFDATGELMYLQLMRRGVSVPADVSIVSFGGATRLGPLQNQLTAVTVDETTIGRFAADLLDEMRSGRRRIDSDERIEIALGFHEGQTLAEPRRP
jgi:GntR family transcriptional regulator, arabinose operon transcriptional repressor